MIKSFREFVTEMVGTGAIYDGTPNGKDFQWWGDPKSANPQSKKKAKKKHSKKS